MSEPSQREAMDVDVVIVGAGPAGLACAIRLKQLVAEGGRDLSVTVLEKGASVGAHILSGAVVDPSGLDALIPDWRARGAPLDTPVTTDKFLVLGPAGLVRIPNFTLPPLMSNHGAYIASLGTLTQWLAEQAEALGVDIYPGFAATEVLYAKDGSVRGVATGDMGVRKDGTHKDTFQAGMELRGKYTVFAEGARGQLSGQIIANFGLDKNCDPQKYGLGLKELWQIDPKKHHPGLVQHTMGWPLDRHTGGGSFVYHFGDNLAAVGFVVHLNYANPFLSPFDEFQRFKTHPMMAQMLEGGTRLAYGARALSEGGHQSVPKLAFPGGMLVGDAAGFMNVPRIKGSHNAVLTGMMAAESAFAALSMDRRHDEIEYYQAAYRSSQVARELYKVRNVKPILSRLSTIPALCVSGLDMWMNSFGLGLPFTFKHNKPDHACLVRADQVRPIAYPKPDGKLSFDKPSSVYLSGTNHEEDQPVHLRLDDPNIPIAHNLPLFEEPATRYCPAGVYEIITQADGSPRFQINAQNCVHCKTCDIKDPARNINWVAPEGGGGPNYSNM
ncbi:MAG: electron transfer flavoprotein-ubiquinone oxidoreductase [Alphaproteobacteria bacterium]